jgi:uncharacterized membrane protein YhiD involved in acid resistance
MWAISGVDRVRCGYSTGPDRWSSLLVATFLATLREQVAKRVVLRVLLYYVVLLGGAHLAWRHVEPRIPATLPADALAALVSVGGPSAQVAEPPVDPDVRPSRKERERAIAASNVPGVPHALTALVAMLGAVLLALPVAWVYTLTRAKRGYQQSVVQTLVILPAVVAGVVVLVKNSLALAFSLAGIVAAVRFRTTLDDSKDATSIFLSTGIGLAAAIDLPVSAVLSVVFNAVVLLLWRSDFGRAGAQLDGRMAERKLARAVEEMGRTGTFVARMDREVFQDMPAEQLQAVADRAWRRARRNNPELPDPEGKREALLRVRTTDVERARDALEPVLEEQLKRWRYGGKLTEGDGTYVLEYTVLLKRGSVPDEVLAVIREGGAPYVASADFS